MMGAWGPGLYSDDFALDLRATISAVCRLPIDGNEIVRLLCDLEPASQAPDDEDHTTFWLVLADQLHRRGIPSNASIRAIAIIDDGSNLETLEQLGVTAAELRARQRKLGELRQVLADQPPTKQRKTLTRPQRLLLDQGQVYAYPVDSNGNCINPYFTDATRPDFAQKRWGAFLVVNAGHALGYLAWYEVARLRRMTKRKPTIGRAVDGIDLRRRRLGTITARHMERMKLELLGAMDVPPLPEPAEAATIRVTAADISLANSLSTWAGPIGHG
jgi:hypothetical protein